MVRTKDAQSEGVPAGGAFLAGALTVLVVLMLVSALVGARVGFAKLASRFRDTALTVTRQKTLRVMDLPDDIRAELTRLRAPVANAGNPTKAGQRKHDSILVRPDEQFGWVVRPGVKIDATMLRAKNPLNLDPPVVYLLAGAELSPRLKRYLEERARLRYSYRTDEEGHRLTLPRVDAGRAILVVGDSVAFGHGVDDSATVASILQQRIGRDIRVVNTGVGGYTGKQVLEVARTMSQERSYDALVYLTSQNDFMEDPSRAYTEVAEEVFSGMAELGDRFAGRLVAVVVSYLQFSGRDLLLGEGWSEDEISHSQELYEALPEIAARHGVAYVDWLELIAKETRESGSIFAPMALHVDHGHLSTRGSRRVADAVLDALDEGEALSGRVPSESLSFQAERLAR